MRARRPARVGPRTGCEARREAIAEASSEVTQLSMRQSYRRPRNQAVICAALVLAAWPAPATADHTIVATDFRLTASDVSAGASPDASSWTTLTYPGVPNTDDVKHTIGHFAAGMVANPEAVPKCPRTAYLADNCPPETLIGSSEADVHVLPPGGPVLTEPGRIYNLEQQGTEAGRLGIIVDASSKAFLEAAFYVRSKGDYGLDGHLDDLPRTLLGAGDIQIRRLKFTLFGTVQGRKFTRGPTSCALKVSTGEGEAYDHPGFVSGPVDSYTPTGCDKLPFRPTFAMSVGSRGTTGERDKPPLRVTVTQGPGEAGILGNGVTLPFEIGPNLPAFTTVCTLAQSAAGACPAASRMGTATATSSFVDRPLTGNVYAVEQAGVPYLPGLVADLRGRVDAQIRIATRIIGGKYIRSIVTDVPDLPVSSFSMSLIGGDKGPLESKFDLCFRRAGKFRLMRPAVTFDAHSGKRTAARPRLGVEGCPPAASASLRNVGRRSETLKLTVQRHPDADNIKRLSVRLPRGAALVSRRMKRKAVSVRGSGARTARARAVGPRTLRVSRLSHRGSRKVTITLRRGAIRLTGSARALARKGRRPRLRIKISARDTAGGHFVARAATPARR